MAVPAGSGADAGAGRLRLTEARARSILTRTSGYLRTVTSHSLQPYRGCSFGHALCGVGCYVRHNGLLTRGQIWGSFLEARVNAAALYLEQHARESAWAHRARGGFSIFMSSSTDPFVPQEKSLGITREVLRAMVKQPPDLLLVQTHAPAVAGAKDLLGLLAQRCELRVHISIESDSDGLPGLPPPAATVEARLHAAATLRAAGLTVVITVAPLLPIADPEAFFARIARAADAVVLDHFVGGDGSAGGSRTWRTPLPGAMARVRPESVKLDYRERMAAVAARHLPGRVGLGMAGFAGHYSS